LRRRLDAAFEGEVVVEAIALEALTKVSLYRSPPAP